MNRRAFFAAVAATCVLPALAQQPAAANPGWPALKYYQDQCNAVKAELRSLITTASQDETRKGLFIPLLLWIQLDQGGFKFASLDDLAANLYAARPSLGSANAVKQILIGDLRRQFIANLESQGARSLRSEIEDIFVTETRQGLGTMVNGREDYIRHRVRFDFLTDAASSSTGGASQIAFDLRVSAESTARYTFARTAAGSTFSVTSGDATRSGVDVLDEFLERIFRADILKLNLSDGADELPQFSEQVLRYFEKRGIATSLNLTDDDFLRLLVNGDEALFRELQTIWSARGTRLAASEKPAMWRLVRSRWTLVAAAGVLGSAVLIKKYLFPSDVRKRVQASLLHTPRAMGSTDRDWIEDYLVELLEDERFDDESTLQQTIANLGCDTAYALWYYLKHPEPL